MDTRLYEAARTGNLSLLVGLLNENPDTLEDVAVRSAETPLHIAARHGHIEIVREVLRQKPSFARELNQDGFSPMNLASANGHLEIVRELLAYDLRLCTLKDRDGRVPLHWAAIKGRVEIMNELLSAFGESMEEVTARGETALHLALKNKQLKAFNVLVEWLKRNNKEELIHLRDKAGYMAQARELPSIENESGKMDGLLLAATVIASLTFLTAIRTSSGVYESEAEIGSQLIFCLFVVFNMAAHIASVALVFVIVFVLPSAHGLQISMLSVATLCGCAAAIIALIGSLSTLSLTITCVFVIITQYVFRLSKNCIRENQYRCLPLGRGSGNNENYPNINRIKKFSSSFLIIERL